MDIINDLGTGWIKLYRSLINWEWYKNSNMVHLFIHLLISANHQEKKWQGQTIKRGQLITGRKELSSQTGISEQSIRTCLNKLKSTNEITIKPTNKNSLITLVNYDFYQNNENINQQTNQQVNQQLTSNQPTTNQQLTTNKNEKNIKNVKNDKNKGKDFIDKIVDLFKEVYERNFEIDYIVTNKGKEKGCAGKILKIYKQKYPKSNSKETLKGLEAYFNACCQINDNWLSQNMSLPIMINKFNEINKILKNGKTTGKSGATIGELAEMFADKFGIDREE